MFRSNDLSISMTARELPDHTPWHANRYYIRAFSQSWGSLAEAAFKDVRDNFKRHLDDILNGLGIERYHRLHAEIRYDSTKRLYSEYFSSPNSAGRS